MEQITTASTCTTKDLENNLNRLWTRNYIFLMISNSFLFFGDNLLLPVLPIYVRQNGADDFQVGIVAAVFFITSIIMRIFTSRASLRLGKRTLLMLTLLVFTLSMLGYYFFASLTVILILRLAQGVGFGASTTLYSTMAANIVPYERMGEGIGYFGPGSYGCLRSRSVPWSSRHFAAELQNCVYNGGLPGIGGNDAFLFHKSRQFQKTCGHFGRNQRYPFRYC